MTDFRDALRQKGCVPYLTFSAKCRLCGAVVGSPEAGDEHATEKHSGHVSFEVDVTPVAMHERIEIGRKVGPA